ncbi:natural killer cell receptor 2B4-like [Rhinoraja longicauda]
MDFRCLLIYIWLMLAISDYGIGAVIGTVGQKALLPSGLPGGARNLEVVWKHISSNTRIMEYVNGKTKTYDTKYTGRVDFHPNDLSLEIINLRTQDTGDYEVTMTLDTGKQYISSVRLDVYEHVTGTQIMVQDTGICNFTLICSVTSGDPTSFRWWRGGEVLGNDSTHHLRGHGETVKVHHTTEVRDVVYKCEARNPASDGTAQIQLRDVCKQTTSVTGYLPWWVIPLIVLGFIVSICICYDCRRRGAQVTWDMLCEGWANWCREEPDQRASFATLLRKPETTTKNAHNIPTDSNHLMESLRLKKGLDRVLPAHRHPVIVDSSSQTPPDKETPAHRHPVLVDSSSQTPPDKETPAHRHPMLVDSSSQTPPDKETPAHRHPVLVDSSSQTPPDKETPAHRHPVLVDPSSQIPMRDFNSHAP